MIVSELGHPVRKSSPQFSEHTLTRLKLNRVPLPVIKTHRLNMLVALKRPGEAHGRILTAGKEHER